MKHAGYKNVANYWVVPGVPTGNAMTAQIIVSIVCEHLGITIEKMQSRDRYRELAFCRQTVCYFVKLYFTHISFKDIGEMIGTPSHPKDHATVIHSIKVIQNLIDTDTQVRTTIENINKKISAKK